MKLTYIGLGNMGGPMALNLIKAGHDLTVFDLDQSKTKAVAARGATAASSGAQAVADADIVFTSLPGPKQSAAAMPQLIASMKAGAIWVDMTTNDRDLVLKLSQQAAEKGIQVLEAPSQVPSMGHDWAN